MPRLTRRLLSVAGVVFQGVDGGAPTFLRGETGAQSTIIPSLDVVLGVAHKQDSLRVMLQVRSAECGEGGGGRTV